MLCDTDRERFRGRGGREAVRHEIKRDVGKMQQLMIYVHYPNERHAASIYSFLFRGKIMPLGLCNPINTQKRKKNSKGLQGKCF